MARNTRIGGIYATFYARNEQFIRRSKENVAQLKRQRQTLNRLNSATRKVSQTFRGLTSTFAAFAGAAGIGAAVTGMSRLVQETTKLAKITKRQADGLDLPIEKYQQLSQVFKQYGGDQEDLFDIIKEIQVRTVEAGTGATVALEAFAVAGIDFQKAIDENTDALELFYQYVDGIKGLFDEGNIQLANFVSNELLGDIGTRFTTFFALGREELEKLADEMDFIADEQIDTLAALRGLMVQGTEQMNIEIGRITAENAGFLLQFVEFGQRLIPQAFDSAIEVMRFFERNLYIIRGALGLLAVRLAIASGIPAFVAALWSATAAATAATGATRVLSFTIGLLGAAIKRLAFIGIIVVIAELINKFFQLVKTTDSVGEAFRLLWDYVIDYTTAVFDYIGELTGFNRVRDNFNNFAKFTTDILLVIRQIYEDVFNKIIGAGVVLYQGLRAEVIGWIRFALEKLEEWGNNTGTVFNKVAALFLVLNSNLEVAWDSTFRFLDDIGLQFIKDLETEFDKFFRKTASNFQQIATATGNLSLMGLVFQFLPTIDPEVAEEVGDEAGRRVALSYKDAIKRVNTEGVGGALFGDTLESLRRLENEAIRFGRDALFAANNIDVLTNATEGTKRAVDDFLATAITLDLSTTLGAEELNKEFKATIKALNDVAIAQGDLTNETEEQTEARIEATRREVQAILNAALDEAQAWKDADKERTASSQAASKEIAETTTGEFKKLELNLLEIYDNLLRENFNLELNFRTLWLGSMRVIGDTVNIAYESLEVLNLSLVNSFSDLGDSIKELGKIIQNEILRRLTKRVLGFVLNLVAPGLGSLDDLFGGIGFQNGGLANRGLALVGEAGPELVDFRRPGRVYTNEQLGEAIHGGGGNNFFFSPNVYSSDGPAVTKALEDAYPIFEREIISTLKNDLSSPTNTRLAVRG